MNNLGEALHLSSSPFLNALISLVAFVILAKAADLLVDKVLRKFTRFTETDVDDRIIDLPVYFSIVH